MTAAATGYEHAARCQAKRRMSWRFSPAGLLSVEWSDSRRHGIEFEHPDNPQPLPEWIKWLTGGEYPVPEHLRYGIENLIE